MFGIVAIGRNEGERLRACLKSMPPAVPFVYVDSGSTDDSKMLASEFKADVIDLDLREPFTAARARNAGFQRLLEISPGIKYVQFIDGDCTLYPTWLDRAIAFLELHDDICAVFGRRRERHPDRSIYNQLCDWEWDQAPIGEAESCGGDVIMRVAALAAAGGYRADLIAGEEPELCFRLRSAGWHVWRLDADMTMHDAGMARLTQWWRRTVRSGYALAQGAALHGASSDRFKVWESVRAWMWGFVMPLIGVALMAVYGPPGTLFFLIYPAQLVRQLFRNQGSFQNRVLLSFFQLMARFAEVFGQIKYMRDRLLNSQSRLIEYK